MFSCILYFWKLPDRCNNTILFHSFLPKCIERIETIIQKTFFYWLPQLTQPQKHSIYLMHVFRQSHQVRLVTRQMLLVSCGCPLHCTSTSGRKHAHTPTHTSILTQDTCCCTCFWFWWRYSLGPFASRTWSFFLNWRKLADVLIPRMDTRTDAWFINASTCGGVCIHIASIHKATHTI